MGTRLLKTLFFFFVSSYSFGQVGIGTDQPRGALEINSSTNGFVPPQVALTSSNASAPVVNPQGGGAPVTGTIVYNTATAGTAPNNVVPGFYYWNGSSWLLLTSQASSGPSQWALTGNTGTSASTNFVGTTDAADFVTRTNNTERMRLLSNGNLGIGTASPASKLDVAAGTTGVQTVVNATGNINDFFQFNVQNTSSGLQAQSGYSATANNGTATSGFAWMGINNSGFNFPTAYNIGGANDVSYVGSGQDMHIANANNTKSIIFSTGTALTPFFNERMRITNAGNVGIGTSTPSRRVEINSGVLGTPPIRLTQQRANVAATSTTGDGTKNLVVDNNGDLVTKINEKRYMPNSCSCTGAFPYTLPADLTTYEEYDGNWSGNLQTNTTLADFILPTAANAIAAGHKYGDVVVIHRGSSYNVVMGTTNTNLTGVISLPANTSVGFALGLDKWYRVF
ncbi:hypothetical protein B0A78_05540 [Flavobacterium columnare NBRC 100251 = ATCC 23463]|uniref:hypothetical protein n=1 Tax=Flavobacterium columnare TaxID=996 RepID=UPI0007F9E4D0|nr:hypothetical protein [Flavobacterium columnare]ANO47993.1 hypothetical protein Pf1_02539 [Flavobacterium columnare]APT21429.1 hypothetical protein BU993_01495 [Flavobacterium columnare]MBF6657403.1 hypothetical protein [Flavobacterium columnare]PDS25083.1 hypothetical protein B0A78_05540 [Flavobacterium columnare NBRC 100251 = ATCC 23463]PTD16311.1 hypothetical protein C6N29_01445 [Flavobacterium columnare]